MRSLLEEISRDRLARTTLLVAALAVALLVRAAFLGTYPLTDSTEARYGEIARVMLETGNWLTPQETPGTAFWGKPPLSAWLSAAAMAALGVNEFAARLPSLAFAVVTGWLAFAWARAASGRIAAGDRAAARERGLIAAAVLATSPLYFVSAGAVMTDPALACATAFILVAFHRRVVLADPGARGAVWTWGPFVAAGLGMLAKGPVIAVYAGLPIAAWVLLTRRAAPTWQAAPWGRGAALFSAIWLPWYVAAELRTPGFLGYFLLGEHVLRYVEPGWRGDLYGRAHPGPPGAIWLHLMMALGAWALALPAVAASLRSPRAGRGDTGAGAERDRGADGRLFLVLCALVPLAFLTFARNLIWTYALPVLPSLAVLIAGVIEPRLAAARRWRLAVTALVPLSVAALGIAFIAWLPDEAAARSTRALVAAWRQEAVAEPGPLAYWGLRLPHSLRFYSAGRVVRLSPGAPPPSLGPMFVLVDGAHLPDLTAWVDRTLPDHVVEPIASNGRIRLVEVERARPAPVPGDGRTEPATARGPAN